MLVKLGYFQLFSSFQLFFSCQLATAGSPVSSGLPGLCARPRCVVRACVVGYSPPRPGRKHAWDGTRGFRIVER